SDLYSSEAAWVNRRPVAVNMIFGIDVDIKYYLCTYLMGRTARHPGGIPRADVLTQESMGGIMKALVLLAAAAALAFAVKGLDNTFFESIHQGCEKWNSEHKDSEYECFYTGTA